MKTDTKRTRLIADEGGSAMTETALLCFFIYGPILMMVLILGDVTLERQQAQIASAYMAWSPEDVSSDKVKSMFFADADAQAATGSTYVVTAASDTTEDAPAYVASSPTGEDDKNIWVKLQLLAVGEWWSEMQWQVVDGSPRLTPVVHRTMDSDARYLIQNLIVPDSQLDTNFTGLTEGQNIAFNWGNPTERALAVTSLLNHDFSSDGTPPSPLRESRVQLGLWHTSVFFDELDSYKFGDKQYDLDLPRSDGQVGLKLKFESVPEEGGGPSMQVGKVWLFNPECKPSGTDVRVQFYDLAPDLFSYNTGDGVYITMASMLTPASTLGDSPDDQQPFRFVQPGDPR